MNPLIRRPEEILAFRSLQQILGVKPWPLWTIGPTDDVLAALQIMADHNIGFLVVRDVVTVDLSRTFGDCLKLMHQHGIRHLPVVESGKAVAVVSVRDLMSEAV